VSNVVRVDSHTFVPGRILLADPAVLAVDDQLALFLLG